MTVNVFVEKYTFTFIFFRFFQLPQKDKRPKELRRWQLVTGISASDCRDINLYEPKKSDRICSRHFVDRKPTPNNPIPTLNLGYQLSESRRKQLTRPLSPEPEPEPKCKVTRSSLDAKIKELSQLNKGSVNVIKVAVPGSQIPVDTGGTSDNKACEVVMNIINVRNTEDLKRCEEDYVLEVRDGDVVIEDQAGSEHPAATKHGQAKKNSVQEIRAHKKDTGEVVMNIINVCNSEDMKKCEQMACDGDYVLEVRDGNVVGEKHTDSEHPYAMKRQQTTKIRCKNSQSHKKRKLQMKGKPADIANTITIPSKSGNHIPVHTKSAGDDEQCEVMVNVIEVSNSEDPALDLIDGNVVIEKQTDSQQPAARKHSHTKENKREDVEDLKKVVAKLKTTNTVLRKTLRMSNKPKVRSCSAVESVLVNDDACQYYTGLKNIREFNRKVYTATKMLKNGESKEYFSVCKKLNSKSKVVRELSGSDEFLIALMRQKIHAPIRDLGFRFAIPPSVVVQILNVWLPVAAVTVVVPQRAEGHNGTHK